LKGGAAASKSDKMTVQDIKTPSFKGKHNAIKSKCFIILFNRQLANERGLTLSELARETGSNYKSLSVLIGRWIRWRYIGFRQYPGGRQYHLLKRGANWINRWKYVIPLKKYISELENM